MKRYALFFALILMLSGCKKETDQPEPEPQKPPCEVNYTGSVLNMNGNSNPYRIFIDNIDRGVCPANGNLELKDIKAGNYSWKAVQESGYLFYPTEYGAVLTVKMCTTTKVNFP